MLILKKQNLNRYLVFFLFLGFCYFSFFLRLTSYPLLMWDESRFAVNALEMLKTNHFIVQSYNGVPDMWNTKPPFASWLMAICFKLIGYNELAVRITSALAATIVSMVIFRFVRKQTQDLFSAFLSGMVFITSIGFIGSHVARTGDADSLAVLFITLYVFYFYELIIGYENNQSVSRWRFYRPAIFLGIAFMTKSSYGLICLPGLFFLIIYFKKYRILFNRHFYFSFLVSLIPILAYSIARENENQGYLNAVLQNDFLNRYTSSFEDHLHPFYYYFVEIVRTRFFPWIYFFPLSLLVLFMSKNARVKKTLIVSLVMSSSILLFLSFSQTKAEWYDAAFYPFASIFIGVGMKVVMAYLINRLSVKSQAVQNVVYVILFVVIFYYPVGKVISYANSRPMQADHDQLKYGPFMKKIYSSDFSSPVNYLEPEYNAHLLFYTEVYQQKNKNPIIIKDWNDLTKDELVATCTIALKTEIEKTFEVSIFFQDEYCTCYKIIDSKR